MNPSCSILDRIAVFTAMTPDWSPRHALEQMHALGLRRVEWATQYPPGKLPVSSAWHLDLTPHTGNTRVVRDLCKEFGIEVACLSGTPNLRDEDWPQLLFDAAECLGCPMVRLGTAGFLEAHPAPEAIRETGKRLRYWVEHARRREVRILVEIHAGCVTSSPELARRMVDGLDPRAVGVILDPGNMIIEGMTSWRFAVELLGDYLAHVHVKNLAWFRDGNGQWNFDYTPLGDGLVDWPKVVQSLESAGYRGLYSFEDFRGGYCCVPRGITTIEKLKQDVSFLTNALRQISAPVPATEQAGATNLFPRKP